MKRQFNTLNMNEISKGKKNERRKSKCNKREECDSQCEQHRLEIWENKCSSYYRSKKINSGEFKMCRKANQMLSYPKVLKNHFDKEYIGIFGPQEQIYKDSPNIIMASRKSFKKLQREELDQAQREEDEEIYLPMPRTQYCHICKINFDDYLAHIRSRGHKKNIQASTQEIANKGLADYFQKSGAFGKIVEETEREWIKIRDFFKDKKQEIKNILDIPYLYF